MDPRSAGFLIVLAARGRAHGHWSLRQKMRHPAAVQVRSPKHDAPPARSSTSVSSSSLKVAMAEARFAPIEERNKGLEVSSFAGNVYAPQHIQRRESDNTG